MDRAAATAGRARAQARGGRGGGGRGAVRLRRGEADDAAFLAGLWQASLRPGDAAQQQQDLAAVLARVAATDRERVVVAEQAGESAGAVLLRLSTVSPLDLEPVVQVLVPTVVARLRRRGVGRALMEAAVTFAEEHGAERVATAADAGSREANRFLARLGFSQHATYRTAPTAVVRARVGPRSDAGRSVGRVLAARRSLRRAQQTRPGSPAGP